jgi:hypothetical protein
MMISTDLTVLVVLQLLLLAFAAVSLFMDRVAAWRAKRGAAQLTVLRGEPSMGALYAMYGSTLGTVLLLVSTTSAAEGNRVLLISLNFALITYVFFFNSWFRSSIFFPLKARISRD